jgi:hypothetical protein
MAEYVTECHCEGLQRTYTVCEDGQGQQHQQQGQERLHRGTVAAQFSIVQILLKSKQNIKNSQGGTTSQSIHCIFSETSSKNVNFKLCTPKIVQEPQSVVGIATKRRPCSNRSQKQLANIHSQN